MKLRPGRFKRALAAAPKKKKTERLEGVPANAVLVIEAPGKITHLRKILAEAGRSDIIVAATGGHIMENPAALDPLGIDADFRESLRGPREGRDLTRLADKLAGADVIVLTDPDAEGDVIAWDVAVLAQAAGATSIQRAKSHGMTFDSITDALDDLSPVTAADAVPGRARAIIDRCTGALFSREGVAVGRISTALLGEVATRDAAGKFVRGEVTLEIPATMGRPWQVTVPVASQDNAEALIDACAEIDAVDAGDRAVTIPARPQNMGEIMLQAALATGAEPDDIYDILQDLYQEGAMSYPRSAANTFGLEGRDIARTMATDAGVTWRDDCLAPHDPAAFPHEAPHLLTPVDITLPISTLPLHDAVRILIGRTMVASGMVIGIQKPDVRSLPAWARTMAWHRPAGTQASWLAEMTPKPGYRQYTPQMAALKVMLSTGLGRPSTWATHAAKFASRGMLDDSLKLTPKARRWLALSPRDLTSSGFAVHVDRATEAAGTTIAGAGLSPGLLIGGDIDGMAALLARITVEAHPAGSGILSGLGTGGMLALPDGGMPSIATATTPRSATPAAAPAAAPKTAPVAAAMPA